MKNASQKSKRLYDLLSDLPPDLLADALPEASNSPPVSPPIHFKRPHIRRIGRAIAIYAACAMLFLGALALLPHWLKSPNPLPAQSDSTTSTTTHFPDLTTTPPVTTAPITTEDPPVTTAPIPPEPKPEDKYFSGGRWNPSALSPAEARPEADCINGKATSEVFYPATQTEMSFYFNLREQNTDQVYQTHIFIANQTVPQLEVLLDGTWYCLPWEAEDNETLSLNSLESTRHATLIFSMSGYPYSGLPDGNYRFVMPFSIQHAGEAMEEKVVYVPFSVKNIFINPPAQPDDNPSSLPFLNSVSDGVDIQLDAWYSDELTRNAMKNNIQDFLRDYSKARSTLNPDDLLDFQNSWRVAVSISPEQRITQLLQHGYVKVDSNMVFQSMYTEYSDVFFSAIETIEYTTANGITTQRTIYHDFKASWQYTGKEKYGVLYSIITVYHYYIEPDANISSIYDSLTTQKHYPEASAIQRALPQGVTVLGVLRKDHSLLANELLRLNAFDYTVTANAPNKMKNCRVVWFTSDGKYVKVNWIYPDTPTQPTETKLEKCIKLFKTEYEKGGNTLTLLRPLTKDELTSVTQFMWIQDVQYVLAGGYESFYKPEDISLYELMYATRIQDEFPDNPYQNDGSMMTADRIRKIVKTYLGIDVTQAMWDRLIADGATYFPEYDAYGFPHTDASGFEPGEVSGSVTEDGKLLIHTVFSEYQYFSILLVPNGNSYFVEAVQQVRSSQLN